MALVLSACGAPEADDDLDDGLGVSHSEIIQCDAAVRATCAAGYYFFDFGVADATCNKELGAPLCPAGTARKGELASRNNTDVCYLNDGTVVDAQCPGGGVSGFTVRSGPDLCISWTDKQSPRCPAGYTLSSSHGWCNRNHGTPCCGDGVCNGGETFYSCPKDDCRPVCRGGVCTQPMK